MRPHLKNLPQPNRVMLLSVKASNTNFKSVDVSMDDIKAHFSSTWPAFVNPVFMRYKDEVHCGGWIENVMM